MGRPTSCGQVGQGSALKGLFQIRGAFHIQNAKSPAYFLPPPPFNARLSRGEKNTTLKSRSALVRFECGGRVGRGGVGRR